MDVYSSSMSAASRLTGTSLTSTQTSARGTSGGQEAGAVSDMAQRCERGKQALRANLPALSDDQVKLTSSLIGVGQGHLFENWAESGADHFFDAEKMCRTILNFAEDELKPSEWLIPPPWLHDKKKERRKSSVNL